MTFYRAPTTIPMQDLETKAAASAHNELSVEAGIPTTVHTGHVLQYLVPCPVMEVSEGMLAHGRAPPLNWERQQRLPVGVTPE